MPIIGHSLLSVYLLIYRMCPKCILLLKCIFLPLKVHLEKYISLSGRAYFQHIFENDFGQKTN